MAAVFNQAVAIDCRALIEACAVFIRLNEENLLSDAVCSADDGDVLLELVTFAEIYETERVDEEL